MKIKILHKHKSINPPCDFELPDFSVLTGKNGSGKTHLLEAIADIKKSEVLIDGAVKKNFTYISFNGLNPNIEETCDPNVIGAYIKSVWNKYLGILRQGRDSPIPLLHGNLTIERILQYWGEGENQKKFVSQTFNNTKKAFDKLTEDDFADNFNISFMEKTDFFTAQFALIFKTYHKRQEENAINAYYFSIGQPESKPALSKREFEGKYGMPPWDFINKILLDMNMPYEVNSPAGTRVDSNFNFKLKDRFAGFEVGSMDLSTGEKVLMSLALAIYKAGGDFGKPDLLLLDEPDAGLHPSMSKMMVDILKKNIVAENNIPTIISTHSPTTIIASEGISIYQMVRGNNIPAKVSTQQAVEILSSDIPFLRISNDKRRQVFVESKYDVNYYEMLTNIYARIGRLPSEPIYLPARTSNGSNCHDVIEVVSGLFRSGNDQVYGIIDWDTVSRSAHKVIVIGENDRYSIENYLLDPLLMGLLFLRERKLDFSYFTLAAYSNYADIGRLTASDAQIIVDKVLNDLGLHSVNLKTSDLHNGWVLSISQEFNLHQGHDLEALYKTKYSFLKSYQREDALKKDVIEKVINDYPHFAPRQIYEAILKIE